MSRPGDIDFDEEQYAEDLAEDAADLEMISELSARSLGQMALETIELLEEQAALKARWKVVKKKLQFLAEKIIPEKLESMGMDSLTTPTGLSISVDNKIYASFPKDAEKRERAFEYLRKAGSGGIIRTKFELEFGTETDEQAREFAKLISENKVDRQAHVSAYRTLNHAQMMSFLREQREAGADPPMDAFGAVVKTVATVKLIR
jgi:hypothetical protein